MNAITPFDFEGRAVRVVEDAAGLPWFVALDVCECLALRNSSQVIARLDEDEKGVQIVDTLGGTQQVATINEPGLYSLTLTSRKPEAKRFKRWITHDVLPALRRTGLRHIHDHFPIAGESLRNYPGGRASPRPPARRPPMTATIRKRPRWLRVVPDNPAELDDVLPMPMPPVPDRAAEAVLAEMRKTLNRAVAEQRRVLANLHAGRPPRPLFLEIEASHLVRLAGELVAMLSMERRLREWRAGGEA